jgi:hypothetical protein
VPAAEFLRLCLKKSNGKANRYTGYKRSGKAYPVKAMTGKGIKSKQQNRQVDNVNIVPGDYLPWLQHVKP